MHPRIEQLLSLRDGEPVGSDVREHVAQCRACAAALQDAVTIRERLKRLPAVTAAPGGWKAVRQGMTARTTAVSRRVLAARFAVAASVSVLAVGLTWRAMDDSAAPGAALALQAPLDIEEALAQDRVAQLQSQSQALEELLSAFGSVPVVERAGAAVPIDTIEAQVQWVDHQLSISEALAPRATELLWRERVDLMNSLVQLRYVEAQRIAM